MEWRQQTSVSCADAFNEAQRWIEEVTGKSFGCNDFRAALENGVLLCDLINQLKPGIIKRMNRLSTPIAGLDNVNVFLKACGKLGLNDSQLFHPGDLQDLSTRVTLRRDEGNRRLKNVLITIYWLGRKAHLDAFYSGPQLNFKAFEGLLGLALSKALDEGSNVLVKDDGYGECRYLEGEECQRKRPSYKRENSADSVDSLDSRALRPNSEGCGSDAEAEQVFKMENAARQSKGYVPPPLLRSKQGQEENERGSASPLHRTYQNQVKPERSFQVNPGWIWSKSLSDIPMMYPVRKATDRNSINDDGVQTTGLETELNQENKRKNSVAAKDSEAQWQDDLTKWKNRRRSTKSDLRRKSQDREHVINQMSNGAVTNFGKNEAKMKRDQQSPWRHNPAPRPYPISSPSKSSSADLRPHTRALLARSYATEAPFSPAAPLSSRNSAYTRGSSVGAIPASDANTLGEVTQLASLASDGAGVTTPSLDFPFSSQTQVKAEGGSALFQSTSEVSQPEHVTNQISTLVTTIKPKEMTKYNRNLASSTSSQPKVHALEDFPDHKSLEESRKPSSEQGGAQQASGVYKYLSRTGSWSGSASLPRGYRRSEGSTRLSSAITARPFGTKQSRMSPLPRMYNVDDNLGVLLNSEKEDSLCSPTKSSLKRQTATAQLRGQHEASVKQKKGNRARQSGAEQGKEVNGAILSGQTSFQTSGYPHQPSNQSLMLPQPYSNMQSHHNKTFTLPSNTSIDLQKADYSDMRVSLTLKPNSIPDFGFHTLWDSAGARIKYILPGSPAELCRLCVGDEVVAVDGVAVELMTYTQWKDKMASALQTGNLTMDIRRYGNKDWSTSEGSHHNQPGQSMMTLNLTSTAPVLIGCSDRRVSSAPSTEQTVAPVSKFNEQGDDVTQEKVTDGGPADNAGAARSKDCNDITRKNQKMREEFFKEKGGSESAISDLQVPSLNPSSSCWSWDREEDRRRQEKWQEEQERLLQEQYQRDQERLEEEWRRAQQDAMDVRKSRNTLEMTSGGARLHVNGLKNKAREEEKQSPGREELKEAKPQRNLQGVQNDRIAEKDWADGSCGFARLSPAHRAKSLSTPVLAGQTRGDQRKGMGLPGSKAEKERKQILEEMKKRTQLLTDNSWIRQRSSSFYKEPVYVGVPVKRYESLDDLDALRESQETSTFSYPRPLSAVAGYYPPSRNSNSRYSTGAILSHGRTVSGRRTCCVCERVLGGAAMTVETLSLSFHLACFQCVGCGQRLRGTETGVQARIRNGKPFCERCYFQLRSTGALPM
ncbi:LIM domain only protein 7b isoform X2 [Mugil cephalus]|uniref:LIM domain only protein 7b isoform X2 n=1 Tax=Mugil cephalus TaxID=48193 RepID=UPI001FB6E949|nr:LIM domain only protein 7b isoform X2 [Mugil cephalus]